MNYQKKANNFLAKNKLALEIKKAIPQTSPLWDEENGSSHGITYAVILYNRKTDESYVFHFWDSIANQDAGKKPTAYDVLACLDPYAEVNTFQDFADAFGYSSDSIKALKIYKAVKKEVKKLKKLLSSEEIEELANIQ